MMAKHVRPLLMSGVTAFARWLQSIGVTPNMISFTGFAWTIGSAALLAAGYLLIGGFILWAAAMLDMVDGTLARISESESKFGAFLDSTLDRYSESITFLGLAVYYANQNNAQTPLLLIFFTLVGSWAVSSYTRPSRRPRYRVQCRISPTARTPVLLIASLILGWCCLSSGFWHNDQRHSVQRIHESTFVPRHPRTGEPAVAD